MEDSQLIGARTLEGEAGDQPEATQRAVAHIIINRLNSGRWGSDVAAVCLWYKQFSCWGNRRDNIRINSIKSTSLLLVKYSEYLVDAAEGEPDPTKGAKWYKNTTLPWPLVWGPEVPPLLVSGALSFYNLTSGEALV